MITYNLQRELLNFSYSLKGFLGGNKQEKNTVCGNLPRLADEEREFLLKLVTVVSPKM